MGQLKKGGGESFGTGNSPTDNLTMLETNQGEGSYSSKQTVQKRLPKESHLGESTRRATEEPSLSTKIIESTLRYPKRKLEDAAHKRTKKWGKGPREGEKISSKVGKGEASSGNTFVF